MSQQPFNSDGGFNTLANIVAGNILLAGNISSATYASPAPSLNGFSSVSAVNISTGNLITTGIQSGSPTVVADGINAIYQGTATTMDVYGFPFTTITRGQLAISEISQPVEANGTWYYQSVNTNTFALYTDSTYSTTVDSTTWLAYTGGGVVNITKQTPTANIVIDANGFQSTFTDNGQLNLPGSLTAVGDIGTDGNISGNYILGDGSQLTNLPGGSSNYIQNGTSSVAILSADGNATIGVNATPVANFGVGLARITGNVSANYFIGNGSQLTGLPATYGNSNVATLLSAFGSNAISTTGTVTAGNTFTTGNAQIGTALLIVGSTNTIQTTNGSAVQFANRVNFNAAGSSIVASGNISGANILGSTLSVSGNVTGNYILGNAALMTGIPASYGNANLANIGANSISTTGNISAGYLFGNASQLTGLPASYSNANVAAYLPTYSGNLNAGNIISSGNANINLDPSGTGIVAIVGAVSATGNITTAGSFVGNGAALTNVTVSIAGNVVGPQANVGIVAGSYNWTFDNTGNITLPTGGDLVFSGNTSLTSISNGNITIDPNGTGQLVVTAITPATFGNTLSVTGTVTSLGNTNGTAFAVVGNGAASNVALGYFPTGNTPAQMAIRDYSTANSIMYFDTTVGSNATGGSFVFRSSNAFTTLATVNTYGVMQPTKPGFRVYGNGVTTPLSTTQNSTGILNGNNWAVDYNQGSYLNSTTGVFTAPVAGLYSTSLNARVANNTAASAQICIVKNYANAGGTVQAMWESGSNCTTNHFGVSSISKLAAGDTLVIKVTLAQLTFDANDSWAVAYLG